MPCFLRYVFNLAVQVARIPGWALVEADLALKIARTRSCSRNVANCLVEPGAEGRAASGGALAQKPPRATRYQPESHWQSQICVFPEKLSQSLTDSPKFVSSKKTRLSWGFYIIHVPPQFIVSISKFHAVFVWSMSSIHADSFRTIIIFFVFSFNHFQI